MAKDPAFLFYSSDFLTGVTSLTMEERGQYITLMCLQHQIGHLDDKTIRLSVGNVSVDVLKKFVKDEKGNLYNKRLETEINNRVNFLKSRQENGKKGGRPKKPSGLPNGKATEKLPEDENEIENININDNDLFSYIESNFSRTLNGIEIEEINSWEDNELTRYAIKETVLKGIYNIKYISTVLYNWKKQNIKTVVQAQKEEQEFKNKKEGKRKTSSEAIDELTLNEDLL